MVQVEFLLLERRRLLLQRRLQLQLVGGQHGVLVCLCFWASMEKGNSFIIRWWVLRKTETTSSELNGSIPLRIEEYPRLR